MKEPIQMFIEFSLREGKEAVVEAATQDIRDIVKAHGLDVSFHFYRDPAKPSFVYASETFADLETFGRYGELVAAARAKSMAVMTPVRLFFLGNFPPGMKAGIESQWKDAVVASRWFHD